MITKTTFAKRLHHTASAARVTVCLAAKAIKAGYDREVLQNYIDERVRHLAGLYKKPQFDHLALEAIFSSAISMEAHMAHEYRRENGPEVSDVVLCIERANRLIEASRNVKNLSEAMAIPYIDPHLGLYLAPYDQNLHNELRRTYSRFVQFQDGILASARESDFEGFAKIAQKSKVLFYDSDTMVDWVDRNPKEIWEPVMLGRLDKGDSFDRLMGDRFLHQNVIFTHLLDRLKSDHPVGYRYCAELGIDIKEKLANTIAESPVAETLAYVRATLNHLEQNPAETDLSASKWNSTLAESQEPTGKDALGILATLEQSLQANIRILTNEENGADPSLTPAFIAFATGRNWGRDLKIIYGAT